MKNIVQQSAVQQAQYISSINDIIPEAVKVADSEIKVNGNAYRQRAWDKVFHKAMNRMAKQAGLRC